MKYSEIAIVATMMIPTIIMAKDFGVGTTRNLKKGYDGKKSTGKKSSKQSKKGTTVYKNESKKSAKKGATGMVTIGEVDTEEVRSILRDYVSTLSDDGLMHGYRADPAKHDEEWHACTIVQQCLDPIHMYALREMSHKSRALAYKAMAKTMTQESFNMLQLQQHSNMLLGEMQDWATTCDGSCMELTDPDCKLSPILDGPQNATKRDEDYNACGNLRTINGTCTYWLCDEEPKMIHQANIDVTTGRYGLGNIWNEPHIHSRNSRYDYFSVYGSLDEGDGPFSMRFSGHHIDVNYHFDDGEIVKDTPVFLGHNPLIVPSETPPTDRKPNDRSDGTIDFLMWENMAGVGQFQEAVDLVLNAANTLLDSVPDSYVPLSNWTSQSRLGALLPAEPAHDKVGIKLSSVDEETFETIWAAIQYTMKFARGYRGTDLEKSIFHDEGKVIWTTTKDIENGLPLSEEDLRSNTNFVNMYIETNDWLYFIMVNSMFTVISESEPTNHMHSILIPLKYTSCAHSCCKNDPDFPDSYEPCENMPHHPKHPDMIKGN